MSALPSPVHSAEADRAGALYQEYSRRIFGYCLRRLRTREEAEDAVQHTFMNAFRSLRTGIVPRSEAAWLFKIADNVCRERRRSAWRRTRVEVVTDEEVLREAAVAPKQAHDELDGLADALAELAPNQRRAILLREWQGLSYREIAGELDLTEGAVETLLFRARRSLAEKLDRARARAVAALNAGPIVSWAASALDGAAKLAAVSVVAVGMAAATPTVSLDSPHAAAHVVPARTAEPATRPVAVGAIRAEQSRITAERSVARRRAAPMRARRRPISTPVSPPGAKAPTTPAPAQAPPAASPPAVPPPAAPTVAPTPVDAPAVVGSLPVQLPPLSLPELPVVGRVELPSLP
jgi:RNA polymerase sigma-70 factor (ECF subfamily)